MYYRTNTRFEGLFGKSQQNNTLNMTPVIDIVFLLIIFFLVVSQFIEAENFPVNVPDNCEFAQSQSDRSADVTTVTVIKTAKDDSDFAVGSEKVSASNSTEVVTELTRLIDIRLKGLPTDRRIVTLRVDKDVCFADAQYALAAVAASTATDIKLAVLKNNRIEQR